MRWLNITPTWPSCTPDDVPERLQVSIEEYYRDNGPPTRGRLRYQNTKTRKWKVFGTIELDGEAIEEAAEGAGAGDTHELCMLAASAAHHLAEEDGWDAFEFQLQGEDGGSYLSRSFYCDTPEPSDWAEEKKPVVKHIAAAADEDLRELVVAQARQFDALMLRMDALTTNSPPDGGPVVRSGRLAEAKQATGASFDEYVLAVLAEASGPVKAAYLRERVGGPRWKLQASLQRLIAAGQAARSGATSTTRYWHAGAP